MTHLVDRVDFNSSRTYDLALVALGFESRARHLVERGLSASRIVAFPFDAHKVLAYEANEAIMRDAGVRILPIAADADVRAACVALVEALGPSETVRIAVDISSFSRVRLAEIVLGLQQVAGSLAGSLRVDFYYSPGIFAEPPSLAPSVLSAAPVAVGYHGLLQRSSIPVGAVFGLGYEPQRALGAFELLEPTRAWAFKPRGEDDRYAAAVQSANEQVLKSLGTDFVLEYDVWDAAGTYYALDSFTFSMRDQYRLVLVPMGPKVFALCCLLIGVDASGPKPAVWRVGERVYSSPVDVRPSGSLVGMRCTLV